MAIADRDLKVVPLTRAEIDSLLADALALAADPVAVKFFTGLKGYIGNRHVLARDTARAAAYPETLDVDQYGSASL